MILAPSSVTSPVGTCGDVVTVEEETEYPFRGEVVFTVWTPRPVHFPLLVRVPGWAVGATLDTLDGNGVAAEPGTLHRLARLWQSGDMVILRLPLSATLERRPNRALAVIRGPLVFSLRIGEHFRAFKPWEYQVPVSPELGAMWRAGFDWEIRPTTPRNYGLCLDKIRGGEILVRQHPVSAVPFDPAVAPVTLFAPARRLSGWQCVAESAAPPPAGPIYSEEIDETVELIPYGSCHLRVSEFPEVTRFRQPEGEGQPTVP